MMVEGFGCAKPYRGRPILPPTTGEEIVVTSSNTSLVASNNKTGAREVWTHNLHEEFRIIRSVIYNCKPASVFVDTKFPGVVARPIGEFPNPADYEFQLLRCNVNLLRIIQLGLTLLDEKGKSFPAGYSAWRFNFKFNLSKDMYADDSIQLLQNSGVQFKKHEEDGIDPFEFAALMMTSGLVLMKDIKWISFYNGHDLAYLLKLLTDTNLPEDEKEFHKLLKLYFPVIVYAKKKPSLPGILLGEMADCKIVEKKQTRTTQCDH